MKAPQLKQTQFLGGCTLALVLSLPSFAGTEMHGGSSVVCFKHPATKIEVERVLEANQSTNYPQDPLTQDVLRDIASVELFDLYLAERSGLPLTIRSSGDYLSVVNERMDLIKLKGHVSTLLEGSRRAIPDTSWVPSENGVLAINDLANPVLMPADCSLIQVAVRSGQQIFFDPRLFSRMDAVNQAALMFHEWFYYQAVARGQTDSRATREAVGIVFKKSFQNLDSLAFSEKISQLGFSNQPLPARQQIALTNGQSISVWFYHGSYPLQYYPTGELAFAGLADPFTQSNIQYSGGISLYPSGVILDCTPKTGEFFLKVL